MMHSGLRKLYTSESGNGTSESVGAPKRRRRTRARNYTTYSTVKLLRARPYSIMSQVSSFMSQVSLIPFLQLAWLLYRRILVFNRGPDGPIVRSSYPVSLGNLINSPE